MTESIKGGNGAAPAPLIRSHNKLSMLPLLCRYIFFGSGVAPVSDCSTSSLVVGFGMKKKKTTGGQPKKKQINDFDWATAHLAPGGRRRYNTHGGGGGGGGYNSSRAIAIFSQTTDNSSDTRALNQIPTKRRAMREKELRPIVSLDSPWQLLMSLPLSLYYTARLDWHVDSFTLRSKREGGHPKEKKREMFHFFLV